MDEEEDKNNIETGDKEKTNDPGGEPGMAEAGTVDSADVMDAAGDEGSPGEEKDEVEDTGTEPAGKGELSSNGLIGSLLGRKWPLLSLFGIIFLSAGLILALKSKGKDDSKPLSNIKAHEKTLHDGSGEDRTIKEDLPPFFIPMPPGSLNLVAKIDFTVVWNRTTSIRYKKKELEIRDYIYRYILKFAEKGEDLEQKSPSLSAEMARIVQRHLGTKDIEVAIKGVLYF